MLDRVAVGLLFVTAVLGRGMLRDEAPWLDALITIAWAALAGGIGITLLTLRRLYQDAALLAESREDEIVRLESERRELKGSEDRFRSLVLNTSDVITTIAADGSIEYYSPSAERIWGYAPEVLGRVNVLDLIHPRDQDVARSLLAETLSRPRLSMAAEMRLRLADDSWCYFDVVVTNLLRDPRIAGIVATFRDITERKQFEEALAYQAFHDVLTDLPNRTLFLDRLERALPRSPRRDSPMAVMFLDLDNFKIVNDTLGHPIGDQLLVELAGRIQRCLRSEDTLARLGGDEFAVLAEDVGDEAEALTIAERILEQVRAPLTIDGHELFPSLSVGIVLNSPNHLGPSDLLRDADLAMYRAKVNGKSRCEVFDPTMHDSVSERLVLETSLRRAIERNEFRVFYQPIVNLNDGQIAGFEALVRWAHPQRGLTAPAEFVPLAEETGMILPIGAWVLEEACRQVQEWQRRHPTPLLLSVNVSPRQFHSPTLSATVRAALERSGFPPNQLKLELTESLMMQDLSLVRQRLDELKDLSIQVAINNFGTGFSALTSLRQLPVSILKIDRAFVGRLGADARDDAIVRSIVGLAHDLGLTVVGEGIELVEQLTGMREIGCDLGQGFYFSAALPAHVADTLLRNSQSADPNGDAPSFAIPMLSRNWRQAFI